MFGSLSLNSRKGLFSIFTVVIILTIYEIVFFYNIVVPQVNDNLDSSLNKLSETLVDLIENEGKTKEASLNLIHRIMKNKYKDDNYEDMDKDLLSVIDTMDTLDTMDDDQIENVLLTSANREKQNIDKINFYTKLTSGLLLVILVCFTLFLGTHIVSKTSSIKTKLGSPIFIAFITVILLIGFQVLFYYFSMNIWYSTDNELLNVIIDSIKVGEIKNNNGSN
jgi:lipopolysaccharide export LptBFGC system permease protein LptF